MTIQVNSKHTFKGSSKMSIQTCIITNTQIRNMARRKQNIMRLCIITLILNLENFTTFKLHKPAPLFMCFIIDKTNKNYFFTPTHSS